MLGQKPPQMMLVRLHGFGRYAVNIDQLMVVAIHEIALDIEYISESAGHPGTKIDAHITEYRNHAPSHVLAAMIASTFNDRRRARVANTESLASAPCSEQLAAGCPL